MKKKEGRREGSEQKKGRKEGKERDGRGNYKPKSVT